MPAWSLVTRNRSSVEDSDTIADAWARSLAAAAELVRGGRRDTITISVDDQPPTIIVPERSGRGGEHDRIVTLQAIDELRQLTATAHGSPAGTPR